MKLIPLFFTVLLLFSCEREQNPGEKSSSIENTSKNDTTQTHPKSEAEIKDVACYFNQLSSQFNIDLVVNYGDENASDIFITVFDKTSNKKLDSIYVKSGWLIMPPMFANCDDVRSFTTKVNLNKEVIDNCHGDFIVADFNFDGLDDFAVAIDNGGNGGTAYAYYQQRKNKNFIREAYLTEKMVQFPVAIDSIKKTLTTSVHASAVENFVTVYQLKNGTWNEVDRKIVKL